MLPLLSIAKPRASEATLLYLNNLSIPAERIGEMSAFQRFAGSMPIEKLVCKVAWHETGHAVSWALNGGALASTTIIPEGDETGVLWGSTQYVISDEPSTEERQRKALAGLGAPAICELAGAPEVFEAVEDFMSSVEDLRPIYPGPRELKDQLIQTWIAALLLFGTPRVWRTADAFARQLIREGTIIGFPRGCISKDNSHMPGLEEALACALGDPGARKQHEWIEYYVGDD